MEWKKLSQLVERKICYGIVQPGKGKNGNIPVIKVNNIISGLKSITELDTTTHEIASKFQRTQLFGGEIVVSVVGSVGNTAIVPSSFKGCNLVRATAMVDIKDKVLATYVMYYFKTHEAQKYIESRLNTTVQATLNIKDLEEMPIPILQSSIILRLVSILSALDAKIENNNKINANLEAQAEALFKSWFVDFTPFKDQPFVDSELGPIPQGWKVGKINEFVDVIYGAPYKSKLFNTQKEGLPLIRIRDLKTSSPQFYTKELLPNTELVNYGDVVAGMDAEFTPHIWLGETGLLNQRVCKFKPHTGISPLYSMLMIKPKLEFAQNYKVGTTVSHLGKSDIDKFIVIVPPLDIVKEVSSIFDAVLNEQINLAKENQRLAALRDTLLPKLMSGEIKL